MFLPAPAARHRISFVLPAFDEEANIARAIANTVAVARRYCSDFEVLVVDDGSGDATAPIVDGIAAQCHEVRLLRHRVNRGYGEAVRTGFLAAQLDYVFFTDAEKTVFEVGVTHLPRTAGTARGAHPRVIFRAFVELVAMYRRLADLGPGPAPLPPIELR